MYSKRGRDASPSFYVAPTGLDCFLVLLPRAMPWASIFRSFGAEQNPKYSNPEIGLRARNAEEEIMIAARRRMKSEVPLWSGSMTGEGLAKFGGGVSGDESMPVGQPLAGLISAIGYRFRRLKPTAIHGVAPAGPIRELPWRRTLHGFEFCKLIRRQMMPRAASE